MEEHPASCACNFIKSYLVFFDLNRTTLNARSNQIIAKAAIDEEQHDSPIWLRGHTDSSGDPDYNKRLSQRRAEAVATQLEKDGVSKSEIKKIFALGSTDPAVPFAPGDAPAYRNRSVDIWVLDSTL
jgi:outer membrane protein OmpA-like peptidoglycan-associated protein